MLTLFNFGYLCLSTYTILFSALSHPHLLYLCTAGITTMNAFYTYYLRRMRKTAVLRIEWDVDSEQFVIVRPKGLLGETQRLMQTADMAMDAKNKQERDCIYFDKSNGEGFATVNRGQWYNMMLFMHVMQKNQVARNRRVEEGNQMYQ